MDDRIPVLSILLFSITMISVLAGVSVAMHSVGINSADATGVDIANSHDIQALESNSASSQGTNPDCEAIIDEDSEELPENLTVKMYDADGEGPNPGAVTDIEEFLFFENNEDVEITIELVYDETEIEFEPDSFDLDVNEIKYVAAEINTTDKSAGDEIEFTIHTSCP